MPPALTFLKAQLYRAGFHDSLSHQYDHLKFSLKARTQNPRNIPFDSEVPSEPPDYNERRFWVAHPNHARGVHKIEDANYLQVEGDDGEPKYTPGNRPAACFFVHDTTYNPPEAIAAADIHGTKPRWNAPVNVDSSDIGTKYLVEKINEMCRLRVAVGASPFNETCDIYAPSYRQMNIFGFFHLLDLPFVFDKKADAEKAARRAYEDIRRSFYAFLKEIGPKKPIVLAGHSQGSFHLNRLILEEILPRKDILSRLLCGYLTGYPTNFRLLCSGNYLKVSSTPDQTCALASWMTASSAHYGAIHACGFMVDDSGSTLFDPKEVLCTSPVSWSSRPGDFSKANRHLGSALPKFSIDLASMQPSTITNLRFSGIQPLHPGSIGLKIKKLQKVEAIKGGVDVKLDNNYVRTRPFDNFPMTLCERDALLYHDVDIALFHFNIRENVATRFLAWSSRLGALQSNL